MRGFYIVLAAMLGVASIWGDAGSWNWFLQGYAWDVALPVLTYFLVQKFCDVDGGWELALLVFAINAAGELAQLFLSNQTFDPWDFVAYAAGSLLALLLDSITPRTATDAAETAETEGRE